MWSTLPFVDRDAEPLVRQQKWRAGRKQIARAWYEACEQLRGSSFAKLKDEAESAAREALSRAIDAYNYLEDHHFSEYVHQYTHNVAEFATGTFGCYVHMEDGQYWDECPLSLMHQRWGFSPGYTSRRICSICHTDIDECPHLIGHVYQVIVKKDDDGTCSGCGWNDCSHQLGQVLDVVPIALHDTIDLHEISMVPRPRDPLARASRIALDTEALSAALGRTPTGEVLNCDRCLYPCSGFSIPPGQHEQGSESKEFH